MKTNVIILLAVVSIQAAIPRAKFENVMNLLNSESKFKYDSAYSIIQKYKQIDSKDPEIFVLTINYYYSKSRHDLLEVQRGKPTKDTALILKDTKTGEDVGYIQQTTEFNIDTLMKGINEFKIGIRLFPNRLDMHFGLVTVAEKAGLYKEMTEALKEILNQSVKNKNEWLWSFGERNKEYSKEFMLHNVQGRAEMLFELQTLQADSLIIDISKIMVEKYPDCIFGYNNLGTCYLIEKEYKKALSILEKALKLDPKDTIVISNLAEAYKRLKDKDKAKEYYLLLSKYGNNEEKERAKQSLHEIAK